MSTTPVDVAEAATNDGGQRPATADAQVTPSEEEPQPWITEEDSAAWRVRFRGRDARQRHATPVPVPIRQSVLVEPDAEQLAWLSGRAAESGRTLSASISDLIDDARSSPPATGQQRAG